MGELLASEGESRAAEAHNIGKVTVLEALAEESSMASIDMSRRSTQMGNGVDAEDD